MFRELYWFLDTAIPLLTAWMGGGLGRRWDIRLDPNLFVHVYLYQYADHERMHYATVVWAAEPKALSQAYHPEIFVAQQLAQFVQKLEDTPPTLHGK